MKIGDLLQQQRLIICVGAGGVGKTSLAATMGLKAALEGRKALVLTIDPAKRLANSLGLEKFGNQETQIDLSSLGEVSGELWAMMLDGRKTFDELITRVAKNEETREAILQNNIYKGITDSIVGNQEYMATEKLYDVFYSKKYDLIILDTPPVKNALDFLDSPGRMARFVDKRIMKWFLTPRNEKRRLRRLLAGTSAALFRLLGYIFGKDFLEDIAVFFQNFRDLYEGFQQRHQAVENIFRDAGTSFFIICAPHESAVEVAHFFLHELKKRNMPNPGVVVNQRHLSTQQNVDVQSELANWAKQLPEAVEEKHLSSLVARLGVAHKRLRLLDEYEQNLVQKLRQNMDSKQRIWSIPRLDEEVHNLQALRKVGDLLFYSSG